MTVFGLQCYKGLGNSSKKHEQEVMECPEGKFYVCVKMFGGGMGDQIRRYCEDISREVLDTTVLKTYWCKNNVPSISSLRIVVA